jgi:ferredoxin
MTTTLYVFTGTGNSLAAAEFLAQKLGDTVIESIPFRMKKAGVVIPDTNKVGFVFPVNYCGVPFILSEFIPRVSLSHVPYIFAVATAGGIGRYALLQLDKMLKKNGTSLQAGWLVRMVDNYIPYGGAPDEKAQTNLLSDAESLLADIANSIQAEKKEMPGFPVLSQLLHFLLYPRFIRSLSEIDTRFHVDDTCNGCGICNQVCPADNIRIIDNKPVWQHHCLFCLACINLCPKEAIQLEEKHRNKRRYHNPSVPLKKLIQIQSGFDSPSDQYYG